MAKKKSPKTGCRVIPVGVDEGWCQLVQGRDDTLWLKQHESDRDVTPIDLGGREVTPFILGDLITAARQAGITPDMRGMAFYYEATRGAAQLPDASAKEVNDTSMGLKDIACESDDDTGPVAEWALHRDGISVEILEGSRDMLVSYKNGALEELSPMDARALASALLAGLAELDRLALSRVSAREVS